MPSMSNPCFSGPNSRDHQLAHTWEPPRTSPANGALPNTPVFPSGGPQGGGFATTTLQPGAKQPQWGGDRRPRLIIADDDIVVRTMLSMALQDEFDVVGQASDAAEAVELIRSTRPAAALIDVDMPNGGGQYALEEISRQAPDTAVVMLSIDEEDSMVRAFIKAGAMAYRRKGTSTDVIATSLRGAIAAHARELALPRSS